VIWQDLLRDGTASFEEAVTLACRSEYDIENAFPGFDATGLDLYSAFVKSILGSALDRPDFTALRYERLRRQLADYLRGRAGVNKQLLRALRRDPPARASNHAHFAQYYDAPTRRLVGESTAWLCERFGYRVGGGQDRPRARAERKPIPATDR
jgi:hypothetical protein